MFYSAALRTADLSCITGTTHMQLAGSRLVSSHVPMQVGMNNMDYYNADFEANLLEASAEFYRRKAAAWIQVCF